MKLKQLQETFYAYVLGHSEKMEQHVASPEPSYAELRLGIYTDAYWLRLAEILGKHYPILKSLLDEPIFEALCDDYIQTFPSRDFSLRKFGHQLAEFMTNTPPYNAKPAYAEMAKFEWLSGEVLYVKEAQRLTAQDLALVPQEQWPYMQLIPHPTLRLLHCEWNVPEVWQAVKDNKVVEFIKNPHPQSWIIWRKEIRAYFAALNEADAWIMSALMAHQNFSEICEGLTQWHTEDQVANYAVNTLLRWLNDGFITQVIIPNEKTGT